MSASGPPGVGDFEQVEVRRYLHLLGVIAGVGLREVEDEIGPAFGKAEQRLRTAIEHLVRRLVAELLQGFEDFFTVVLFWLLLAILLPFAPARRRVFRSGTSAGSSSHTSYSTATFNFVPVMRPPIGVRANVGTPQG